MKKYAEGGMTPAELAAFRLNKGKSTAELLQEDKARTIKKKMESMPEPELPAPGATRPGEGLSDESRQMMQDTNAGYEYTKKRNFKSGGMASKRADGCAVRGKTKGRMV